MGRSFRSYRRLGVYIGREYVLSFLVSFAFFFFIFFVNQILVLAQKILIKNVGISDMLTLVVLSIPQFLMYTMPFSSLAAASMVIGNFASQNEILAMKSCGIRNGRIFRPIIVVSIVFSVCSLAIANYMIPYTAQKYRQLYAQVLKKLPTVELTDYSSTSFGNYVIANGEVDGSTVENIIIHDNSTSGGWTIGADKAQIDVVDIDSFTYRIDLEGTTIVSPSTGSSSDWSSAYAESMTLYLTLGSQTSIGLGSTSPSQMSISELWASAQAKKTEADEIAMEKCESVRQAYNSLGDSLESISSGAAVDPDELESAVEKVEDVSSMKSYSFYYQYYRSELTKKIALSLACTFLVFIAFPISFFKVKNGRLIGFGISMLLACFYWFFLYFMHSEAVRSSVNPSLYIWLPNAVFFIAGLVLIHRMKNR